NQKASSMAEASRAEELKSTGTQPTEAVQHVVALASSQVVRTSPNLWRRFRRHRLPVIVRAGLWVLLFVSVFAPLLTTQSPTAIDLKAYRLGPSTDHPLGTDTAGRDIFSRLLYAGRVSLSVGLVAVSIYTVIGVVLGALAGYFGGWIDSTI